jgi:glutathione synthase/RimK-type ligase-like ATP-grasp enzyme
MDGGEDRHQILVVAVARDLHARAVVDALRRKGVPVAWVDFADPRGVPRMALSIEDTPEAAVVMPQGGAVQLESVHTIWWRRPRAPDPSEELDSEVREFVTSEWEHFLASLEAVIPARWVNPPAASRIAARKVEQAIVAREEGLSVPRTLVTNDPEAVRGLAAEGRRLIYKRLGTAHRPLTATKELRPSDLDRLEVLPACPAIFQDRVDARLDIRVTIMGTEVFGAEIESQMGSSPLDWRFDHTVPFRPHQLDDTVATQLLAMMKRLSLLYGAIDLRLTPEGEYVFLEVNPGGQYLFVELLGGVNLSERFANFLAAG